MSSTASVDRELRALLGATQDGQRCIRRWLGHQKLGRILAGADGKGKRVPARKRCENAAMADAAADKRVFSYGEAAEPPARGTAVTGRGVRAGRRRSSSHGAGSGATPQELDELIGEVVRDWAQRLIGMGIEVKGLLAGGLRQRVGLLTAGNTRRTASTTSTPTRRGSAAGCGSNSHGRQVHQFLFIVALPLVIVGGGSSRFFAVGAFFEALEDPAVLGKRIEGAFRKPAAAASRSRPTLLPAALGGSGGQAGKVA
jgi:hypothetical protein